MQVKYTLRIGKDEFELNVDVKNEKELFEKLSFYSNLPRTAPGGSDDLKLVFRTTKDGHKYYSLVSEKEKMEFKLGQNKENQGGGLFPKGWSPAYQGDDNEETQTSAPAPAFGSQPNSQFPGMVNPTTGPTASTPAPAFGSQTVTAPQTITTPAAPVQAATPPAQQQVANPQVAAVANNVLSRFGIKQPQG